MREWETATWATGQTEAEVIRRVGKHVAIRAQKLTRKDDCILVLAGKGHNGDDARAAVDQLKDCKVNVLEILQPDSDRVHLEAALREMPALIIDGLFGIGLNRLLDGPWQSIINTINAANLPVLSVDVPSGLNADTGETFGAAVRAVETLTIGAPKCGLLALHAEQFVGRIEVANDVGLASSLPTGDLNWSLAQDFKFFPPPRPLSGHKGSFGHVAIIAGSAGFHGAAVLAVRGAQCAQPGLITAYPQENVYFPVAAQLQSAMVQPWRPDTRLPEKISALLIGPGLAARDVPDSLRRSLHQWWRDLEFPIIADASALDFLAGGTFTKRTARVITPHPGEAARILNWTTEKVQANRVAALRELSRKSGNCWVVLKGHHTLIGRSDGDIFVNPSGNPHLAQGGSGDLLAGYIAGLLAQPPLQKDIGRTLRYAAWQHGATADQLQANRRNWTIEDLARELGNIAP